MLDLYKMKMSQNFKFVNLAERSKAVASGAILLKGEGSNPSIDISFFILNSLKKLNFLSIIFVF